MAFVACLAVLIAPPAFPQEMPRRTEAAIKEKLKSIAKTGKAAGKAQEGSLAALRRLNAYRYLCGVPYDIGLDEDYAREAAAAAAICERLGRLDHHPENPGMAEKDYELASHGAKNSNHWHPIVEPRAAQSRHSPGYLLEISHDRESVVQVSVLEFCDGVC